MDYKNERKNISISTLCLCMIVILAFSYHLILYTFSNSIYILLFACVCCVGIISKHYIKLYKGYKGFLWLPAMATMILSFLSSNKYGSAQIDVIVLFFSFFICMFYEKESKDYWLCLKIIVIISNFYVLGVLLEQFLPGLYQILVKIFPSNFSSVIIRKSGMNGFTTNVGFAAAFIVVGIIAIISILQTNCKHKRGYKIMLVCSLIALICTDKRAHPILLFISLMLCYLLSSRGTERMKRYWNLFVVFVIVVIGFFAFKDILAMIPFVSSIIQTIDGFLLGEDVTTGRTRLFIWAWKLFLENPIFGIGWGDYRQSIVGTVTIQTDLDTHNIYLQLLAETGMVGLICFMIPFVSFWIFTKNAYCDCMLKKSKFTERWRGLLMFSLALQTFFLLHGLTGNPLYDANWQILYMFSCSILGAYSYKKLRE